jgi:hypothetical protein
VVNDLCAFKGKTTLEVPPGNPAAAGKAAPKKPARALKAALRKA